MTPEETWTHFLNGREALLNPANDDPLVTFESMAVKARVVDVSDAADWPNINAAIDFARARREANR